MSTAIDNFTSQLHDNLEAVEDSPKATLRERAKSLNKSIKSAAKKNQAEIQYTIIAHFPSHTEAETVVREL